ncbi:MAG: 16S rRNA (cytidine(1402)-2'-O)-methyltransferase [Gammaproteobacteria bacterium]
MKDGTASLSAGLYIVATPIGNLEDITYRAVDVLGAVDSIAAEDTRHSRKLLQHFGLKTPLLALHEHNEKAVSEGLLEKIRQGRSIALISDAGTPLMSDPGFYLVRLAHENALPVIPVPGVSAAICALSAAGLPTDRFVFEGFPPAKKTARKHYFDDLQAETGTLIFYESSHRIIASLEDMASAFGADRQAVIARELTKTFETIHGGRLADLVDWVQADKNQQKGEFVVLVHGMPAASSSELSVEDEKVLLTLLEELSLKQAASLASRITGVGRRVFYERALALKEAL